MLAYDRSCLPCASLVQLPSETMSSLESAAVFSAKMKSFGLGDLWDAFTARGWSSIGDLGQHFGARVTVASPFYVCVCLLCLFWCCLKEIRAQVQQAHLGCLAAATR